MRRAKSIATVAVAMMLALTTAATAEAGYGAIAYDQDAGKQGASWNQATPAAANEAALKACASPGCKVHPVEPAGCGALALSDKDKAWGGADREKLEAAKREAVAHCQTHTTDGTCTVRVSGCNK
jgi:hypothetical protein